MLTTGDLMMNIGLSKTRFILRKLFELKIYIILTVILIFGEISIIIFASGRDYTSIKIILELMWTLCFLPFLFLAIFILSSSIKYRFIISRICLFFLLFLYFSTPALKYANKIIEKEFRLSLNRTQEIIENLDYYYSKNNIYPASLESLIKDETSLEIPVYADPDNFYSTSDDGQSFELKILRPDYFSRYEYSSSTKKWEYPD